MRLDRNKYALLRLRNLAVLTPGRSRTDAIVRAVLTLDGAGLLDWGRVGNEDEFFVIKLRDRYAAEALNQYARTAREHGYHVFAAEISDLASRAGERSPFCKAPD